MSRTINDKRTVRHSDPWRTSASIKLPFIKYGVLRRYKSDACDVHFKEKSVDYIVEVRHLLPGIDPLKLYCRPVKPSRFRLCLLQIVAALFIPTFWVIFLALYVMCALWRTVFCHVSEPLRWGDRDLRRAGWLSLLWSAAAIVFAVLYFKTR